MPLEFVTPPKVPTLNIFLYGLPKMGKTTSALNAPGPILYLNAEGPNAAMYARQLYGGAHLLEAPVTSPQTLLEGIEFAKQGKCKTVVLDSVSAVFQALLDATTMVRRFYKHLRDTPVNFIVIAQEFPVANEETGIVERKPYTGTKNPALGEQLMAWADVISYCGRKQEGEEPPKYIGQLFTAGGRHGGDRTGVLGESRELDMGEWINTYVGAMGPKAAAKAA